MGWFSQKVQVEDSVLFKVLAHATGGAYNYALDFGKPFSEEQIYKVIDVILHDAKIEFDKRQNYLMQSYVTAIIKNMGNDSAIKKCVSSFAEMLKSGKMDYESPNINKFKLELINYYG